MGTNRIKKEINIINASKIILLGILFGVLFGLIDSVVDVIYFTDQSIIEHLFNPSPVEIWMRSVVLVLFILFSVYISRIINKLRRAEEMNQKSESQSRKAQKIAGLGFWDLDLITGELYWSDEIYGMLGYKINEIVPSYEIFKDRLHPDDRDYAQKHVDAALNDDIPYNIDFRYLFPTGDIRYVNTQAEVTRDENGKAIKFFGTQIDITERKKAEEALKENEEKYRTVISCAPVGIVTCDPSGQCSSVNKAMARIVGATEEEILKQNYHNIESWKTSGIYDKAISAVTNKRTEQLDAELISSFGRKVNLNCHFLPLGSGDLLIMMQDVSDKVIAERKLRYSENYLMSIIETEPECVKLLDSEGRIVSMNPSGLRMIEADSLEQVKGQKTEGLIVPEHRDAFKTLIERVINGERGTLEFKVVGLKGTERWLETSAVPFEDESVNRKLLLGVTRDITQRKKDELERERLNEELEMYRFALDRASDTVVLIRPDAGFDFVNESFCKALGYTCEELLSMGVPDVDPNYQAEHWKEHWPELKKQGSLLFETLHKRKDGSTFPVELSANYFKYGDREYNLGFARDITERKRAEEALRESEEKFRALFDHASDSIFLMRLEGNRGLIIVDVNAATCSMHGYSKEELIGQPISMLDDPEMAEQVQERARRVMAGESLTFEGLHRKKDGTVFPVEISTCMYKLGKDKFVLGIDRDITERKKAEEALENERIKFLNLLETLPAYVYLQAPDYTIRFANRYYKEHFGETENRLCYESLWGRNEPCTDCPTFRVFDSSEPQVWEWLETPDNRMYQVYDYPYIDTDGTRLVLELGIDITERKLAEEALKSALSDKDMLMKEIHHRVKNNLAVIQSLLSLQMRDIHDEKSKEYFHDAQNRVKSMTMIHEILHGSDDLTKMKVKDYVKKFVGTLLYNYSIKAHRISLQYDIQDIILDVDTMIPLGLIINELVSNALKYAFPDNAEGELRISLRKAEENSYELTISDSGIGLPEGFDIEKAKSLGLLIVTSLVNQINGNLEISNKNGAEFRIIFTENPIV
jgi:PAS domain S-box-containing protein